MTPGSLQYPTPDAAKAAICAEIRVGQKDGIYVSFNSIEDEEGITFRNLHIYGVRIPGDPVFLVAALSAAIQAIIDHTNKGGPEDEEGK